MLAKTDEGTTKVWTLDGGASTRALTASALAAENVLALTAVSTACCTALATFLPTADFSLTPRRLGT